MKKYFIILFLAILFLTGGGCVVNSEKTKNAEENFKTLKGVSLSPKSFESDDFTDFFVKAKEVGEIISWAGDWEELGETKGSGPTVVAGLASTYNYIPVIETQFFAQSTGKLIRPLDENTKKNYQTDTIAFAKKYKPKYLGLGIEVNILYEESPQNFENFVQFYNEIYDAVKIESPDTKIFTVFQLEKMKGLNGGLFGGENTPEKTEWQLLDKFKIDLAVFTTYPSLIYKNPADIPENYYLEIKSHTEKPIAFTELGWPSETSVVGWESNETEQAEFVEKFFDLTEELNKEMIIWSFLYDQDIPEPFRGMGLYRDDGIAKDALNKWLNEKE